MNFFKKDWNKPGPGVPKNAPKKKGLARVFEVVFREFNNLIKLNLLLNLFLLGPLLLSLVAFYNFTQGNIPITLVALASALCACIPLGAAFTSFYYILVQMLRDEPLYLWHDFKRKYVENFKNTILPGIVLALLFASMGFMVLLGGSIVAEMPGIVLALYLLAIITVLISFPFFFVQMAFVDLPLRVTLQNSLLLAFANLPRSMGGALFGSGLVLAQLFFVPFTVVILLIVGLSFPALLNVVLIWSKIDGAFKIDATLKKRRDEEFGIEEL